MVQTGWPRRKTRHELRCDHCQRQDRILGNSYGYDAWQPALQDVTKMRSGKLEPDPQPEIDFLGGRSRARTADLLLVRQAL